MDGQQEQLTAKSRDTHIAVSAGTILRNHRLVIRAEAKKVKVLYVTALQQASQFHVGSLAEDASLTKS